MMSFSDAIDTASERHMEHILPRKLTEPKNRGLEDVFPSRSMMFRFHISFPGVGCIEIESLHWKKIQIYQLSDIFFFWASTLQNKIVSEKDKGSCGFQVYTYLVFYLSLFGRVTVVFIILFRRNLRETFAKGAHVLSGDGALLRFSALARGGGVFTIATAKMRRTV